MDKDAFLAEMDQRLHALLAMSKEGLKPAHSEQHRLEGFMQAALFLGFITRKGLSERIDQHYQTLFGKSRAEYARQLPLRWPSEQIDYRVYERPSHFRTPTG